MPPPSLPYDPRREALYQPQARPALFATRPAPSEDALCAELARLAYLRFERLQPERERLHAELALAGLQQVVCFHEPRTGTEAYGAVQAAQGGQPRRLYLVFRGTRVDNWRDALTDAHALPWRWPGSPVHVHAGFARAWRAAAPPIEAWLADQGWRPGAATGSRAGADVCVQAGPDGGAQVGSDSSTHTGSGGGTPPPDALELIVTGHSLGAALATLAAWRCQATRLLSFGGPRVGCAALGRALHATRVKRFVCCADIVPRVPPPLPWYAHVGGLHYIDRTGCVHAAPPGPIDLVQSSQGPLLAPAPMPAHTTAHTSAQTTAQTSALVPAPTPEPTPALIRADRRAASLAWLRGPAWGRGHLLLRELADHAPINYSRALW